MPSIYRNAITIEVVWPIAKQREVCKFETFLYLIDENDVLVESNSINAKTVSPKGASAGYEEDE